MGMAYNNTIVLALNNCKTVQVKSKLSEYCFSVLISCYKKKYEQLSNDELTSSMQMIDMNTSPCFWDLQEPAIAEEPAAVVVVAMWMPQHVPS